MWKIELRDAWQGGGGGREGGEGSEAAQHSANKWGHISSLSCFLLDDWNDEVSLA